MGMWVGAITLNPKPLIKWVPGWVGMVLICEG
jgi:hypothetical protein